MKAHLHVPMNYAKKLNLIFPLVGRRLACLPICARVAQHKNDQDSNIKRIWNIFLDKEIMY